MPAQHGCLAHRQAIIGAKRTVTLHILKLRRGVHADIRPSHADAGCPKYTSNFLSSDGLSRRTKSRIVRIIRARSTLSSMVAGVMLLCDV